MGAVASELTQAAGDMDVLFRVERGLGWITLSRPRVINALTPGMVRRIDAQLVAWADDDRVAGVVVTGAGERGLCAGGDIVTIYRDTQAGRRDAALEFWRDEYVMNARIAAYPKPYLAVMTGIVMGGGVGVSAHGSIRVVTETTGIAMPETGIGFCPDVGGTWLLSRAPGELGTHLALTGSRAGAGDALACGLADHYLPSGRIPALLAALSADSIATAAAELSEAAPASPLRRGQAWIDACYQGDSVPEILGRLAARPEPAAREAAQRIAANSPLAVSVTLRALRRARGLTALRDVLDQDLRAAAAAFGSHDLREGIRAQVIDKDRSPRWSPPDLAGVTADMTGRYFAPLPPGAIALPSEVLAGAARR